MGAQTIRFLIQLGFAFAGMAAVVLLPPPYGPTLGLFLVVAGLWLGRRVFRRIARLDEEKADLRRRLEEGKADLRRRLDEEQ
ncbi:hypothetical protein [uncultured Roseibium sp.]|uniref:hypothetical protein n=1 Tax=uncultured Roseibium sp. TaxID=1936171 RepID=UPI00261C8F9A|nr:hypothetical protein [uncultured Roseibium sp.]